MSDLAEGSCGVCITDFSDGDMPVFFSSSRVRARKAHVCCECGDAIPVGAEYERASGKWETGVDTYKTCLPCAEIRHALCCEGWTFTRLWADAEESDLFANLTTGCLAQLTTAAAKAKLLERWRQWKGIDVD